VRARDIDNGPLPLLITLSALSGTFDDPNAEDTTYRCESPGVHEICVEVTDGACPKSTCTFVSCP
jgi:hypothetical protein